MMRPTRRALASLVLGLGLALAGGTPASAQSDTTRLPLDDPTGGKPGSFFQEYSGLVVPNPSWEAEESRVIGGPERIAELTSAASSMSSDALGRELMRGLGAVRSSVLNIRALRAIFQDTAEFQAQVSASRQVVSLPNGTQGSLPVLAAWRVQRSLARAAARALGSRPGAASLAGSYVARTEGSECPMTAGAVELSQQGRAVEMVQGDRLLFGGMVGQSETAWLANEQRYATIVRDPDGARIEAPDRALELYAAPLGDGELVIKGTRLNLCTVTLTRAR
jgi:hypothetical protein